MRQLSKILKRTFLSFAFFVFLLLLTIQFAPVQKFLARITIENFFEDYETPPLHFERLKVGLTGKLSLYELKIDGDNSGEILKLHKIQGKLGLIDLFRNRLKIKSIYLEGLNGQVLHYKNGIFNFDTLLESFSGTSEAKEPKQNDLSLAVGKVELKDIKLRFHDSIAAIFLDVDLGHFKADITQSDLLALELNPKKVQLKNTNVQLVLDERIIPALPQDTIDNAKLPIIDIRHVSVENVQFKLIEKDINSLLETKIGLVKCTEAFVDIGQEVIRVQDAQLKNSSYFMDYVADTLEVNRGFDSLTIPFEKINFSGGWNILAENIKSKNTSATILLEASADTINHFNPLHFTVSEIDANFEIVHVHAEGVSGLIKKASLSTPDNFKLKETSLSFNVSNNFGFVDVQKLLTPRSNLKAKLDGAVFMLKPDLSNSLLKEARLEGVISLEDINYFLPDLIPHTISNEVSEIRTSIDITGNESEVTINALDLNVSDMVEFSMNGSFSNFRDADLQQINLRLDTLRVARNFFFHPEEVAGLSSTTDDLHARLSIEGSLDSIVSDYTVSDGVGKIHGKAIGFIDSLVTFSTHLKLEDFTPGKYVADSPAGQFDAALYISGQSYKFDSLSILNINGTITTLEIDSLVFDTINFAGAIKDRNLDFKLDHESAVLIIDTKIKGSINPDSLVFDYSVELSELNVEKFFTLKQATTVSAGITGNFNFKDENHWKFSSRIEDNWINGSESSILLPPLLFRYTKSGNMLNANLNTEGLDMLLATDIEPMHLAPELLSYLKGNLNLMKNYTINRSDNLKFQLKANKPEALQKFISTILLDTLMIDSINIYFSLEDDSLTYYAYIPGISYKNVEVNNFKSNLDLTKNQTNGTLSLDNIAYKDFYTSHMNIGFERTNNVYFSLIDIEDREGLTQVKLPLSISHSDSLLLFGVQDNVEIGGKQWEVSNNKLFQYNYATKLWSSNEVHLFFENQSIQFEESPTQLRLKLTKLNMANIASFFRNADTTYINEGLLTGILEYRQNETDEWLLNASAEIEALNILDNLYGNIFINVEQPNEDAFKIITHLKNKNDSLTYQGYFHKHVGHAHRVVMDIENAALYSAFLDTTTIHLKEGAVKAELDGDFRGGAPVIDGYVNVIASHVSFPILGAQYNISQGNVGITENGFHFEDISVKDLSGNELKLGGDILTGNYLDYTLDLSIKTDRFQLLNTRKEQNENLYGTLDLKADIMLAGTLREPEINAQFGVHEQTNLTLVLPGEDPLQSSSEGIVRFSEPVEMESDSAYIARNIQNMKDSLNARFTLGESSILLSFDPRARFTVVADPISGDYAFFGLNGVLEYRSLQNNLFELNGNIQVTEGLYQMSFYQMVKKEFTIEPKSTIYFSGPLNNATIDLSAKHIVRTNSLGLMSGESVGNSPEEKALYNQRLPYELYFNVSGLLLNPSVNFALDLPAEYKQSSPMIASKLNKLAGPESEQERNMQVFALLVTGGFITQSSSGSSSGSGTSDVATATARNSINSILSQQLNNITGNNIQFIDLNFGLNTYEDYARRGGRTTTDLDVQISKKLFDDRVSFEMESRINLDGTNDQGTSSAKYNTDYKLYYNIDEKGVYKIKAYNLAIYDLFYGDITNAGIGLMYSKDFEGRKKKNYVEKDAEYIDE
jgi:hypothetical protein